MPSQGSPGNNAPPGIRELRRQNEHVFASADDVRPRTDDPRGHLRRALDAKLRRRRRAGLGPGRQAAELPTVGLALSGGGVRSATFGLGLLQVVIAGVALSLLLLITAVAVLLLVRAWRPGPSSAAVGR